MSAARRPERSRGRSLSHVDARGEARMVDVSAKESTRRTARAAGYVRMNPATRRLIESGEAPKGSVLAVARVAGIQAAKRTPELIPLCHPLPIEKVAVDFEWEDAVETGAARLRITSEVTVTAKTGVEMEALTAVAVAALAVYDMAKSADPAMAIEGIRLVEKRGGKRDFGAG